MRQQSLILTKFLTKIIEMLNIDLDELKARAENQQRIGCDYGRVLG